MRNITTAAELKGAIQLLENDQLREWPLLRNEFLNTYENLKPLNIIKNTFREFATTPDIQSNLLNTTLGVTAGHLSKNLLMGVTTGHPVKKIVGAILQYGISNAVSKNLDTLKWAGQALNFIFKRRPNGS